MAEYAHVNNGIIDSVIAISTETITASNGWFCPTCGVHKPLTEWVKTDIDIVEGVHKKNGTPLHKNYAGIGYAYDHVKDMFIPPKNSNKFTFFNETTGEWEHPTKKQPKDGDNWIWSEQDENWVKHKIN